MISPGSQRQSTCLIKDSQTDNVWPACLVQLFCFSTRYRHAAPSAPWPWMNFDIDVSEVYWPVSPSPVDHSTWSQYPQSLFRNWTCEQVKRSQMLTKCSNSELSTVYKFDVFNDGKFDKRVETLTIRREDSVELQAYWHHLGISVSVTLIRNSGAEVALIATVQYPGTSTVCQGYVIAGPPNTRNKVR